MNRVSIFAGVLFGTVVCTVFFLLSTHAVFSPRVVSSKLRVTTSFYPLYFFTKEITADDADVTNLTPAGAEPHEYELTPKDMMRLQESHLIIVNGVVEPWLQKVQKDFTEKKIPVLTTGDGLFSLEARGEGGRLLQDPHIWLSPRLAKRLVERIRDVLIQKDGEHGEQYRLRTETLIERLTDLDERFVRGLAGCGEQSFVTAHAAFGYLAADYGLTQMGIAGLSPDAEPTAQALAEIAQVAKSHKIPYIFFETLTSSKLSDTIAHEIGARTLVLNPLEGLSEEEVKGGKTYFTEMQQNLDHLRLALACPPLHTTPSSK